MTEYVFVYKCRKCNGIAEGARTTNKDIAFFTLVEVEITGHASPTGASVTQTTIHSCDDGGYGIADLQGFSKRDDK